MASSFSVVVLDRDGRVVDYALAPDIGFSAVKEYSRIAYDIYRTVAFILSELGYTAPRNLTVNYDGAEITVFPRRGRIIVAIYLEHHGIPRAETSEKATAAT